MIVADSTGTQLVLKIHRLGRISFRTVKTNRDYLRKNKTGSWQYLSRLAATKEFAFLSALHAESFPVPSPIAHSRHTIVMSLVDAPPLRQIASVPDPAALYAELVGLLLRLARHGLIHGDFNEFNILLREDKAPPAEGSEEPTVTLTPVLIDFPQMVSMDHANAEMYFDRDVACLKTFFSRRFHFVPTEPGPFFADAKKTVGRDGARRLDAALEASGFTKKMAKDLEAAIRAQETEAAERGDVGGGEEEDGSDYEEDDDEEEEGGGVEEQHEPVVIVVGGDKGSSTSGFLGSEQAMEKLAISGDT